MRNHLLLLALLVLLSLPACGREKVTWEGIPQVEVNGTAYLISGYLWGENALPEGFAPAGTLERGECAGQEYYTSPEHPRWVYVRHQEKYQRYVDEAIRGDDYLCLEDRLYISLWSAGYHGDHPDMTREEYEAARSVYGVRIEGDPPPGYVSLGKAEFSGYDTVPTGALSCNTEAGEVFADPHDPRFLLLPTVWYTHTDQEEEETRHTGYNVYVLLTDRP